MKKRKNISKSSTRKVFSSIFLTETKRFFSSAEEIEQLENLNEKLRAIEEEIRSKKTALLEHRKSKRTIGFDSRYENSFPKLSRTTLDEIEEQIDRSNSAAEEKIDRTAKIQNQIEDFRSKIERADRLVHRNLFLFSTTRRLFSFLISDRTFSSNE